MKAILNFQYGSLGGFGLVRDLTKDQESEACERGILSLPLMRTASDFDVTIVTHPDQEPFVRLQDVVFSGSPDLPGPGLFRNHMSAYRRNGWALLWNSTRGLFTHSPAYKKVLMKPVSMNMRLRAFLTAAN